MNSSRIRWLVVVFSLLFCRALFSADVSRPSTENLLKQSLIDAEKQLGTLEPWQKNIYLEEVVADPQRFVRNYSASNQGLKIDIDFQNLKQYLLFYAPKYLKQKDTRILVLLKSDLNCAKCVESAPSVSKLIQSRLIRRGFNPVLMNPEEISDPKMTGKLLDEQIGKLAEDKKYAGALVIQLKPAPADDMDTAHADENRYITHAFLQIKDLSSNSVQKELFDADSFETYTNRLFTDLFTELGAKLEVILASAPQGDKEEVLIEVSGIRDFSQYNRIKSRLQANLKDVLSLEDRKFSPGQVTFAVITQGSIESLKTQFSTLELDPGNDRVLKVEVK